MNSEDSIARVASGMASAMWARSHANQGPKMDDREEYLTLVVQCVRALRASPEPYKFEINL